MTANIASQATEPMVGTKRFVVVVDPGDLFTVWDNFFERPAFYGGRILVYATRRRAQQMAAALNLAIVERPGVSNIEVGCAPLRPRWLSQSLAPAR